MWNHDQFSIAFCSPSEQVKMFVKGVCKIEIASASNKELPLAAAECLNGVKEYAKFQRPACGRK